MLREFLTLVVPLLLPTAFYLIWLRAMRWAEPGRGASWEGPPWVWLAASGVALAALVLFVVTVHFGTATPGIYVPAHVENGRIVPGRIVPRKQP
jgi:hypothetical protein